MRKIVLLGLVAAIVLVACDRDATAPEPVFDGPQPAATASTSSYKLSVNLTWDYSQICPESPDIIDFSGAIHFVFHTTIDANGRFHMKRHSQPMNLKGVSQLTGDAYVATGVTQREENGTAGEVYTFVNNVRLVNMGSGVYRLLHNTVHYTVNPNGDVTADFDKFTGVCK